MMKNSSRQVAVISLIALAVIIILPNNNAQAQNRCPPGQSEVTLFGIPSTSKIPNCTSKLPDIDGEIIMPGTTCPKNPNLPKRYLPGVKADMGAKIPEENGHRYINVGDGKFVKTYISACMYYDSTKTIHNGERVKVIFSQRTFLGDTGFACHEGSKVCGYIFLADLRPLKAPAAGLRADENAGKIEGLNEKFYVAVPEGKALYLYSQPKFSQTPLTKLSNGTPVTGAKNNHPQHPSWKKICTTKICGFANSKFLKTRIPVGQKPQTKTLQITAAKITVFAQADGFSKEIGSLIQHQFVDVHETVINEEGVSWTRICKNGCGWVPTEDLK